MTDICCQAGFFVQNVEQTYRFKKCREKSYWTCRRHDIKSELCKNGRIPENDIYAAFVTTVQ